MRVVALLILIISVISCRETSLAGSTYCSATDFVGDCYYFKTDSTFESRGWTCMGGDTGVGHYRLTKDSLIFYYDTLDAAKGRYVYVDSSDALGDSCEIKILCRDQANPLVGVVIVVMFKSKAKGTATDTSGVAKFKIAKSDFPIMINCNLTGYQRLRIDIARPNDYKLNVQMRTAMLFNIPAGTVHAYAMKKLTRKEIRLKYDYIGFDSTKQSSINYLRRSQ